MTARILQPEVEASLSWPTEVIGSTIAQLNEYLKQEIGGKMNDEFAALVPPHRTYINRLIEQGIIDHYVVTMESQRVWITFSAEDKKAVEKYLSRSPLFKYWSYEIDELFMVDGLHYRLPVVQLN